MIKMLNILNIYLSHILFLHDIHI